MKTFPRLASISFVLLFVFFSALSLRAIPITSSKGKTVDFAGVKSASSAGLEVQVKKDGSIVTLPWSRLDLRKLETENPKIHAARKKSLEGEKVDLNLGSFVVAKPKDVVPTGRKAKMEAMGIYETTVKGKASDNFSTMKVAIKLPGGKAKGVFVYISGAAGQPVGDEKTFSAALFDTTSTPIATRGPWFAYAAEHGLAILGIAVDGGTGAKKGAAPYYEVAKGTGDALYRAIDQLATAAKREELKSAPLLMYGRDVGGAAFVYNLAQWKPERVAAVVAAKGAFYKTEPSEASAKVPLLFIQGEYDDDWKLYGGENLAAEVFGNAAKLSPNWVYALEPRGTSGDSLQVFSLVKIFLNTITPLRLGGEGLKEVDRSASWVGGLEAKTISKAGGSTEWTASKSWLPDARFAKSWQAFVNGEFQKLSAE
ncbi:MAG: hypothetical protein L3J39_15685 [Verrucomicrobiales bacterium]|nr:hypothetical protein [Verrucomicrobiales bacterium]